MDNDILKFLIKIYICLYVGLTKYDINQFGVRKEKKLAIDDEKKKREREWLKMALNDLTNKKWILEKYLQKIAVWLTCSSTQTSFSWNDELSFLINKIMEKIIKNFCIPLSPNYILGCL